MSLLEIDGLTHSFGENVLYKNAGFTLNKGEHIGIVGQNGTGKSTPSYQILNLALKEARKSLLLDLTGLENRHC